jgi:hypothetical protein
MYCLTTGYFQLCIGSDHFIIYFLYFKLLFYFDEDGRRVGQSTWEFSVNITPVFVCMHALLGTVSANSLTPEEESLREMSTCADNFSKI